MQDVHIKIGPLPPRPALKEANLTALGGGAWSYGGPGNHWRADVVRPAGSTTADLYFEPAGPETGRPFELVLVFEDGRSLTLPVRGGKADPGLRMPSAALRMKWLGQRDEDRVGPTAGVGPDGRVDAAIELAGLAPEIPIKGVEILGPGALGWAYGLNPGRLANAELVRDPQDPARAVVFIQPTDSLEGRSLAVTVQLRERDQRHHQRQRRPHGPGPPRARPGCAAFRQTDSLGPLGGPGQPRAGAWRCASGH